MSRTPVVVGIVTDDTGRVLVNQRTFPDRYQGKWEFPGGKVEAGETPKRALGRELKEELNIEVTGSEPLITINHDYPDRQVTLFVFRILDFRGVARGAEGQSIQWVSIDALANIDFLEANHPVINAARLPDLYLITDVSRYGLPRTLKRIEQIAATGRRCMVQIREKHLDRDELHKVSGAIRQCCHDMGIKAVGNMQMEQVNVLGLDGIHLSSGELHKANTRPMSRDKLVGASCHNLYELKKALMIEADFAVLSSIQKTTSHPTASALGWDAFEALVSGLNLPIYALGGLAFQYMDQAKKRGGQGIAILSRAWEE